jgi:hypothetical protein
MNYTNQANVENFLGRVLTAKEILLLPSLIETVSDGIISVYTGREYLSVGETLDEYAEAEDRLFDGNGAKELYIDDFTGLTKVNILDSDGGVYLSLTTASEFIQYPLNKTFKESLMLRNYHFPVGPANVLVNAIFSSGPVPEAIVYIATALVSRFMELQGESVEYKNESIEGYSYEVLEGTSEDEETENLLSKLDRWKKVSL